MRRGMTLIGSTLEPFSGCRIILLNRQAFGVRHAKVELRLGVIVLGGTPQFGNVMLVYGEA